MFSFLFAGPPMQTEDPFVPALGFWEVNVLSTAEGSLYAAPIIDINYGLQNLQLTFNTAYMFNDTQQGMDGNAFELKWLFHKGSVFSIALNPKYTFSPHSKVFMNGDVFELGLPMNMKVSKNVNIILNISYVATQNSIDNFELGSYIQFDKKQHHYYIEYFIEENSNFSYFNSLVNFGYSYDYQKNRSLLISFGREIKVQTAEVNLAFLGLQFIF